MSDHLITYWKVPPNITDDPTYLLRLNGDDLARRIGRPLTDDERDMLSRTFIDYLLANEDDVLDYINEVYC